MGFAAMTQFIEALNSQLPPEKSKELLEFSYDQIRGRIWEGKESLFVPMKSLCKCASNVTNTQKKKQSRVPGEIFRALRVRSKH